MVFFNYYPIHHKRILNFVNILQVTKSKLNRGSNMPRVEEMSLIYCQLSKLNRKKWGMTFNSFLFYFSLNSLKLPKCNKTDRVQGEASSTIKKSSVAEDS